MRPFLLAAFAVTLSTAVSAQETAPLDTGDEVVVTGTRESTLDLKRLLAAQRAFLAGRVTFAPESRLIFELRPKDGVRREGITLTLRRKEEAVPVPIDAEGRFTLPALPGGGWSLLHNRGKGRIAVRLRVLSPDTREDDRRLGDLRLQCRAGWEIVKVDQSIVTRTFFGAAGGCASPRIHAFFGVSRPIADAEVRAGTRTEQVALRPDGSGYRPPIADQSWPDTARIVLHYR